MGIAKKMAKWPVIALLGAGFMLFAGYLFPTYQLAMNEAAGQEVRVLDTRFFYGKADAEALFLSLGSEGRSIYRFVSGVIDMAYPLFYGGFLFLLLLRLSAPVGKPNLLVFAPLAVMLFDYIENMGILKMIASYPNLSEGQVLLNATATGLKWTCAIVSFGFLLFLLSKLVYRRMLKQ